MRTFALLMALLAGMLPLTAVQPVLAAPIVEVEDNDTAATAQVLPAIGLDSPVQAAIPQGDSADNDWFAFQAQAGQTYVVELYNVDSGLTRSKGNRCSRSFSDYPGLALTIYDSSETLKSSQCSPSGSGNVHTILTYQAQETNTLYVRIFANSSAANMYGNYMLRILPATGTPGAAWDSTTFEPNNRKATAYQLGVGLANAVTTTIEQRNPAYATNSVDIDWYRFDVVQGRTYVVELYNAHSSFNQNSGNICTGSFTDYIGLAMRLYNATDGDPIAERCSPSGAGNVHTILRITAQASGPHYIQIFANANTTSDYGSYSLRILPQHEEEGASWDEATFEPNNNSANAYPIAIGRNNALLSTIEARDGANSTNFPDGDEPESRG
jgi:cytochrome c2